MIFLRNDFLFLNRSRNLESSLVLNFLFWHLSNPRKKNSVFGGDFLFSLFFSFWGEGELAWNYTMNLNTSWQLLGMSELLCDPLTSCCHLKCECQRNYCTMSTGILLKEKENIVNHHIYWTKCKINKNKWGGNQSKWIPATFLFPSPEVFCLKLFREM